jgi:biotin synthase
MEVADKADLADIVNLEAPVKSKIRNNWTYFEIEDLYNLPFADLLFTAQQVHRMEFNPNQVQKSTLLSIKTGSCPEDCKYCPQSGHYHTKIQKHKLMSLEQVKSALKKAKAKGASRFCMGAAWRSMPKAELEHIGEMVKLVKEEGLESCLTLGMLDSEQVESLKDAGLDYYNHNLDTSPEYYEKIITTRTYQERLDTLERVRSADIKVCCGGIVGMGESFDDRVKFIQQLANLPKHPESVPINRLVPVKGTPLGDELLNKEASEKSACCEKVEKTEISEIDFVKTVAVARITMPKSYVRLSAGRETMSDSMQAMCFLAGANSIFYGEKLLTTPNPSKDKDELLFEALGIESI